MPLPRLRLRLRLRPRPRPLVLALGAALLASACASAAGHDRCGDPAEAAPAVAAASSDAPQFRIQWLGDTLLADAAEPRLRANGYGWPFARLLPLLDGDYIVANAEGPITTETKQYDRSQRWAYNAAPAAAEALAAAAVDAAGLANNHALDRGPAGLSDTIAHLEGAGVASFGGGGDRAAALRPLLIETPHGRVAVVALGQGYGARKNASEAAAGTVPATRCAIEEGAALARAAGARWLVGYVHWGSNYSEVQSSQRRQARLFAEAGYDLVVGHGAHVQQQIEIVDGVPVLYSLGNFVFGTPGRFDAAFPGYGLVATSALGSEGFTALTLRCILTDNDAVRFQPRPCGEAESARVLQALHPDIEVDGLVGTLRWP